jgi:methionyl-tRNA synthetase
LDTALFVAADAVRVIAELTRPFMPQTSERALRMLGVEPARVSWKVLCRGELRPGTHLTETAPLFPRIEQSLEELQNMSSDRQDTPSSTAPGVPAPSTPAPGAPSTTSASAQGVAASGPSVGADRISIEDFMKVELRTARVIAAERVPKSSKLLKLQVDTGIDQRTIVAGIAEAYEPEALVGRAVIVVVNLKPAKLMGVESNGMVLAASPDGAKPVLAGFDEPPAPGCRVR